MCIYFEKSHAELFSNRKRCWRPWQKFITLFPYCCTGFLQPWLDSNPSLHKPLNLNLIHSFRVIWYNRLKCLTCNDVSIVWYTFESNAKLMEISFLDMWFNEREKETKINRLNVWFTIQHMSDKCLHVICVYLDVTSPRPKIPINIQVKKHS